MATCSSLTSLLFGLSALAALCMARPVSRGEFIFTNVEFQSPLSPDHVNLLSSLLPGNTNLSSIVGNNNYSSSWWSDLQHEQRWDASVCTESSGSSSSFCKVLLTCNYLSAYNSARDTFTALGQNDSGLADMANKMDAVIKCLCGTWKDNSCSCTDDELETFITNMSRDCSIFLLAQTAVSVRLARF